MPRTSSRAVAARISRRLGDDIRMRLQTLRSHIVGFVAQLIKQCGRPLDVFSAIYLSIRLGESGAQQLQPLAFFEQMHGLANDIIRASVLALVHSEFDEMGNLWIKFNVHCTNLLTIA
jgi:hypothetical protein